MKVLKILCYIANITGLYFVKKINLVLSCNIEDFEKIIEKNMVKQTTFNNFGDKEFEGLLDKEKKEIFNLDLNRIIPGRRIGTSPKIKYCSMRGSVFIKIYFYQSIYVVLIFAIVPLFVYFRDFSTDGNLIVLLSVSYSFLLSIFNWETYTVLYKLKKIIKAKGIKVSISHW